MSSHPLDEHEADVTESGPLRDRLGGLWPGGSCGDDGGEQLVEKRLAGGCGARPAGQGPPARLRLRDRNGRWLVFHASCLTGGPADGALTTVRFCIKSVFEKVGVSTRGELVAKLFADHYSDPMHSTAVHIH